MNVTEIQKQFDLFSNMYRALSNVVAGLPLHPDLIKNIAHDIDTAFLWVKEGLQAASAVQQQQEAAQADVPVESILPPDAKVVGIEDAPQAAAASA